MLIGPKMFQVQERPLARLTPKEVRIHVRICGVCASELHTWLCGPKDVPLELGHEVAGDVVEVGRDVSSLKPGTPVTGLFDGGFAEYAVATEDRVAPVPQGADVAEALGEPLACVVSATARIRLDLGGSTAIVGVGFMGLTMLQAMRLKGARRIIAIDLRDDALEVARQFGADEMWKPKEIPETLKATLFSHEPGRGVDVAIEVSGTQSGLTLAGELVREHGQLAILGYHTEGDGMREVDMRLWNWKALDVLNAHERRIQFKMACLRRGMALLAAEEFNLRRLITHRFPLHRINDAFSALHAKAPGFTKAVVAMNG